MRRKILSTPAIGRPVAFGVDLPIPLPEEKQGHPLALKFLVDFRPVWKGTQLDGDKGRRRKKLPIQFRLIESLRQGPA
jgi:hypothetical protein